MGDIGALEKDTLGEIGNISLGSAATALSSVVGRRVDITTPHVELTTPQRVRRSFPVPSVLVNIDYVKGLTGNNLLIIKEEDAAQIAAAMMGNPDHPAEELGEIELSAIGEAMNQMMGAAATSLSDLLQETIEISPPVIQRLNLAVNELPDAFIREEGELVQVRFRLIIEGLFDSMLIQLLPLSFAHQLTSQLIEDITGDDEPDTTAETYTDEETAAVAERTIQEESHRDVSLIGYSTESAPVPPKYKGERLALFSDIPVKIDVVLGRTRLSLAKVFTLAPGAVVELDKYEGEPVEIFANGCLVGWGEVVLYNGYFGVKITGLQMNEKVGE
ncbi:MAG: flagellar motor switch phosphatase FliY [Dethiobacteria bacterium]|jgi:flagellar motor switch protein FliN/FliY